MVIVNRRGKLVALSTAAVGIVVMVAAGIAANDRIREEWWLWRLSVGDPDEEAGAAQELGRLRSVRAVPLLVAALRRTALPEPAKLSRVPSRHATLHDDNGWEPGEYATRFRKALVEIGPPATFEVLKAIRDWDRTKRHAAIFTLIEMYSGLKCASGSIKNLRLSTFEGILLGLKGDWSQSPDVCHVATELLART